MNTILDENTKQRMLAILQNDNIKIKKLKFVGKTTNHLYQIYNADNDILFNCSYSFGEQTHMRLFVDGWCFGEVINDTKSKNSQNIFTVCQAVIKKHRQIQK